MLELYHWAPNGPWLKPLIVLAEKEIPCTLIPIDVLAFEQYGPALPQPSLETRLNLEGEGPLLVHDGRQLTESFFMSEYLDTIFDGADLRPTDPVSFNRMLAWARFVNEVFMPAVNTLGCRTFLAPKLAGKTMPDDVLSRIDLGFVRDGWRRAYENDYPDTLVAECHRKIGLSIDRIETALQDGDWLLGDRFTLPTSMPLPLRDRCRHSPLTCCRDATQSLLGWHGSKPALRCTRRFLQVAGQNPKPHSRPAPSTRAGVSETAIE